MIGRRSLMLVLLISLSACDSWATPTPRPGIPSPPPATATMPPLPPTTVPGPTAIPTSTAAQTFEMYLAASNDFFNSSVVHDMLRPGVLRQKVVYIYPTFDNRGEDVIPDEILALLARHTAALGLTRVPEEVDGGLVVAVGSIRHLSESDWAQYGGDGLTIGMTVSIGKAFCSSHGIGYLLRPTSTGWQAEGIGEGVC